jgi:hypothetical protein
MGFVLLCGCRSGFAAGQPVADRVPMPIVRMRAGPEAFSTYTGVGDSLRTVVRDSVIWRQLWQQINRPFFPQPALPVVDFGREMIVVAGLGARPSGGYDVIIESAARDSAGIEVALRRAMPGPGCPVPAVMTQPLDLVRIPASGEPVRFREHTVVVPCGTR